MKGPHTRDHQQLSVSTQDRGFSAQRIWIKHSWLISYDACHIPTWVTKKEWNSLLCPSLKWGKPLVAKVILTRSLLREVVEDPSAPLICILSSGIRQEPLFYFILFCYFLLFRPAPAAYESFQARDRIRATSVSLHHSHSNIRSKPLLWPIPQLTATPDP